MNEENNVNQETEEKKEVVETASVAEEKKVESTEKVDKEKEEKVKKMDEIFADASGPLIKDVAKIAGRDLTDAEKKELLNSLKAFFVLSSLMLKAFV